jgi:hypothetical protein
MTSEDDILKLLKGFAYSRRVCRDNGWLTGHERGVCCECQISITEKAVSTSLKNLPTSNCARRSWAPSAIRRLQP